MESILKNTNPNGITDCGQSTLNNVPIITISNEVKEAEINLAAYIAVHCSIRSIDHLSEVIKTIFPENKIAERIKLHLTKCSMIIKHVIEKTLRSEIVKRIGNSYYSLIINESTDVSTIKYMCLCVRYFDVDAKKIATHYSGIFVVERATAEILADGIKDFLNDIGLNLNRLSGRGTDGASNLWRKSFRLHIIKGRNSTIRTG
ncbi:hypothetical protein TcasGA2_TC004203 [Tribolium castaneum]|uniref:DUF4371 domain-containing protein n=1 Tax=Tribolium castaneum TaxID=7070 RepID=D7EJ35_TRICA|nr:hypothetical protein TcasGA2_TC004203 [Tribolium castaneum]